MMTIWKVMVKNSSSNGGQTYTTALGYNSGPETLTKLLLRPKKTLLKNPGGTLSSIFHLFYIEIPKLFKIEGNRRKYIHIFDQNKSFYFRIKCFYF